MNFSHAGSASTLCDNQRMAKSPAQCWPVRQLRIRKCASRQRKRLPAVKNYDNPTD